MTPVTGTTSTMVIQSMPSMKLTRLTNHTPLKSETGPLYPPRQKRQNLHFAGSAATMAPTATNCSESRSAVGKVRRSSIAPTQARNAVATETIKNC